MADTHTCPGGCQREVPRRHFACKPCWYRLPGDLQAPITNNYRRDPGAHLQAMADAVQWYAANPPRVKDPWGGTFGVGQGGGDRG
jgi:hypothetical protein